MCSSSFDATTITVGIPIETSSAWLGPYYYAPILASGISCFITSSNGNNVSLSNPFEQIIIG